MVRRRTSAPESKQRKVALAFAGPGESTIENTTDLLEDFLGFKNGEVPEDDVLDLRIAFPVTKSHLSAGLKNVVKWTDNHELAYDAFGNERETPTKVMGDILHYAERVENVKVVEAALIDWLADAQKDGYEARLILLWGDEDDESIDRTEAEILLDLADSFDIKALDLTAGLDDLAFGDEEEAVVSEPEPEPEPAPKRDRSRRRREPEPEAKTDDPPWDPEPEVKEKAEERPAPRPRRKKAEEIGPTPPNEETLQESIARLESKVNKGTWSDFIREMQESPKVISSEDAYVLLTQVVDFFDAFTHPAAWQGKARALEARFWVGQFTTQAIPDGPTKPVSAPQEAEEAPKRGRGRPRTRSAAERAVKEYWDPEDEKWVRAGRGRIAADLKTRWVDPETGQEVEK